MNLKKPEDRIIISFFGIIFFGLINTNIEQIALALRLPSVIYMLLYLFFGLAGVVALVTFVISIAQWLVSRMKNKGTKEDE